MLKKLITFVVSRLNKRAKTPDNSPGYFYAHNQSGVAPPWISCNGSSSPRLLGLDSGTGGAAFNCPPCQKTTNTMQSLHQQNQLMTAMLDIPLPTEAQMCHMVQEMSREQLTALRDIIQQYLSAETIGDKCQALVAFSRGVT